MTKEIFEMILTESESSILDFKKTEYDFSSSAPEHKKGEFLKDIICFSNTIRKDTAYIIVGVEESDSKPLLIGIEQITDDSILQQKVKGFVFPVPVFRYYPFLYENLIFGIIEFPVRKYDKPITPTVKLKGLQPGTVYFRRNSSNDEASATEVIEIYNWLNSLSPAHFSIKEHIQNYLIDLLDERKKLSLIIIELLAISKKNDLILLSEFCDRETKGLINNVNYTDDDVYPTLDYRAKTVTVSPYEINLSAVSGYTSTQLLQLLRNEYGAWEQRLLLQYSTLKIENYLKDFPEQENTLLQIKDKMSGKDIYIYFDKQTLLGYYHSIREELKNLLINLL